MLKELIETIVMALVDNPEQVKVSEIESGMTLIIELRVADVHPETPDKRLQVSDSDFLT